MKINGSLTFDASSASEIQNLRVQKLPGLSVPVHGAADRGRVIYVTVDGGGFFADTLYVGGMTAWAPVATGGDAAELAVRIGNIIASLGASVDAEGIFQTAAFAGFTNVTTPADLFDVLEQLDLAIESNNELAELDDVVITAPVRDDVLQYDFTGGIWENKAIGVDSGIQAYDAGLDALAAYNTNGILVQTTEDTFAGRSLVAPAEGIIITDPDGVAGNPTFALANDLAALEGLATTGYIVRTGTDTATTRSITGNAGRIEVTNGNGVVSDTSIDLATVGDTNTGTFEKVNVDTYGRVIGTTPVVAADITPLVDATYVNVTGDTMDNGADIVFAGGGTVTGLPSPIADTDAANKAYVDALAAGLSWKDAARVATVGNVDIATALEATDVIDGVTLVAGDRVLVRAQTLPEENGIYVVQATGAAVRATDLDQAFEFSSATVFVQQGTTHADSGWTQTNEVTTVGTDPVSFSQFSGAQVYTWGVGLSNIGNTVNVNLGAGIVELPSDEVGIDLFDSATGAIILTTSGTNRTTDSAARLHLLLAAAGGLAQDATGLYIAADGVTNAMLVNEGVTTNADTGTGVLNLGGDLEIAGSSVQGIATLVTGSVFTISGIDATTTQKGVASFNTDFFSVASGAVSLAATLDDLLNVSTADAAATNSLLQKSAGDWVAVSPADVAGDFVLDDIGDVAAVHADGHVLTSNGTNWVNQKIYHLHTEAAPATTWTVTHNLGTRYCNVTVVDNTEEVVIPQAIVFDSTSALTVTFNTAVSGYVVVMGLA